MKLDELVGTKRFRQMGPLGAVEFINKEFAAGKTKLKFLGRGTHAVALTNGQNVFKFWYKDSAYENFVEMCLKHQDNPWFPKFKSGIKRFPKFLKIQGRPQDINYIKMELLQPMTYAFEELHLWRDKNDPAVKKILSITPEDLISMGRIVNSARYGGQVEGALMYVIEQHLIRNGFDEDDEDLADYVTEEVIQSVSDQVRECMEACLLIKSVMSSRQEFDYGLRNMAMRGDQPVFLDPIMDKMDVTISDNVLNLSYINAGGAAAAGEND